MVDVLVWLSNTPREYKTSGSFYFNVSRTLKAFRYLGTSWSWCQEICCVKDSSRCNIRDGFLPNHRGWRRPWKDDPGWFLHKRLHSLQWTWWPWVSTHIPNRKGLGNSGSFPKGLLSSPPGIQVKTLYVQHQRLQRRGVHAISYTAEQSYLASPMLPVLLRVTYQMYESSCC